MPVVLIDDISDPRLIAYRELKDHNHTSRAGRFITEGDKLTKSLLNSSFALESVLVERGEVERWQNEMRDGAPLYAVSSAALSQLVGFHFHRGVLACGKRRKVRSLNETLSQLPVVAAGARQLVVACAEVQHPDNLGNILRAALGFGAAAVLLGPGCADPFSRRVLRVSMGASLFLPLAETHRLVEELDTMRSQHRFECVATVLDATAEPLDQFQPAARTCLLLGNEGNGLSPELVQACDRRVTIAMHAAADSLNVAMAAGIFLYRFGVV